MGAAIVHAGLAADVQGPDEPRHSLTRPDMKLQVSPADVRQLPDAAARHGITLCMKARLEGIKNV